MDIITPVAKISSPSHHSDYRPISVLPLFSTILEEMVVRRYLYPLYDSLSLPTSPTNFLFAPQGPPLLEWSTSSTRRPPYLKTKSMLMSYPWTFPRLLMLPCMGLSEKLSDM